MTAPPFPSCTMYSRGMYQSATGVGPPPVPWPAGHVPVHHWMFPPSYTVWLPLRFAVDLNPQLLSNVQILVAITSQRETVIFMTERMFYPNSKNFSHAFPYSSNQIIVFIRTMYPSNSSCTENSGKKTNKRWSWVFYFLNIYLLYPLSYSAPAFSCVFISVSILWTFLKSNRKALYNFQFILLFPQ